MKQTQPAVITREALKVKTRIRKGEFWFVACSAKQNPENPMPQLGSLGAALDSV